ncbi:hypothetical protein N7G274_003383 [Stereocaulon virgatum]|uniref:Uncharacterized protein n=1 Tax=Stereocaulon virgatum TaxID=373712 RepID=A0ABR4AFK5_9LECA
MQTKFLISAALFSVSTFAGTNDYNIDYAGEAKISSDASKFLSTVQANPAFQSDMAAVLRVVPSSVVPLVKTNPADLIYSLATATSTPDWVSNIPTPVIDSLATLYAKPVIAIADGGLSLASALQQPPAAAAMSVFIANAPTSVQNAYQSDSVSFILDFAAATPLPAWASNVPAPVQKQVGSIINKALSTIGSDLTASTLAPTITPARSGFKPSAVSARPTGTGSVAVFKPSGTGSIVAFTGAAAPMKTAAAGAVVLAGAAGVLLHF